MLLIKLTCKHIQLVQNFKTFKTDDGLQMMIDDEKDDDGGDYRHSFDDDYDVAMAVKMGVHILFYKF